ncbi:hypothetical protein AMECASPLE_024211 [Ameca splendens]|uniref:Uncharacterized protein n=1 Tax=Ameca splendens TaxID=208324 RepID=A0ABV0YGI5_9TELE
MYMFLLVVTNISASAGPRTHLLPCLCEDSCRERRVSPASGSSRLLVQRHTAAPVLSAVLHSAASFLQENKTSLIQAEYHRAAGSLTLLPINSRSAESISSVYFGLS